MIDLKKEIDIISENKCDKIIDDILNCSCDTEIKYIIQELGQHLN